MSENEKLIPGWQLIEKLGIDIFELCYLTIKYQLTVMEDPERPLRRFVKSEHRTTGYRRIDSEELLGIIQNKPERLGVLLFLLSEIKRVPPRRVKPKKHGSSRRASPKFQPTGFGSNLQRVCSIPLEYTPVHREVIEDHEPRIKKSPNVFSLLGEIWCVKFNDQEFGLYVDNQKHRYIANVLSLCDGNQRTQDSEYSIYNTELYAKVTGKPTAHAPQADGEVLAVLPKSDLNDTLSKKDNKRFREIGYELLGALQVAREAGNQALVKKAEDNIDIYRSHLSNEYRIRVAISKDETKIFFRNFYRPPKEGEKIRQIVKNQISNALKDFDRMPKFKSHLRNSLKTRLRKTVYSPEYPIVWTVSA